MTASPTDTRSTVAHARDGAENVAIGAYGVKLDSVETPEELRRALLPCPAHWISIDLLRRVAPERDVAAAIGSDEALLPVPGGGQAVVRRHPPTVTFITPRPFETDRLVHPLLGYVGAVFAHWLGRLPLHGGGFVVGESAWGLLGGRESGKSSTLAWLAARDYSIVSDDLLVVTDGHVLCGPRSIDLRPASAAHFRPAATTTVRGGVKERLRVGHLDPEPALRGWITLSWGPKLSVRPIAPDRRISELGAALSVRGHVPNRVALLDLVVLPAFEIVRPKRLDCLDAVGEMLVELVEGRRQS